MTHRVLLIPGTAQDPLRKAAVYRELFSRRRRSLAAAPGQFDYPTQKIGTTPDGNVTVYYDPSLGQQGSDLAQQVLNSAADTYNQSQAFFAIAGSPVNVIIAAVNGATDGSGGAYHYGCNFNPGGDLYVDAAFGNLTMTNGLFVAELTESFMGAQAKGWDCGASNGEALSRFLAEQLTGGANGALAAYATGPAWDQAGRPNWIDATEPTDGDAVSTGCGVVYLYWMLSLGYTAAQLTQAGCPDGTLASNYSTLTGNNTAWADFSNAVSNLQNGINGDDPFSAG
ncbi:MAG: hypothetical protein JOZ43_09105 [Acidobacteriales bacterium]|nr:hypothetical protein [Terriglobales bacterium]